MQSLLLFKPPSGALSALCKRIEWKATNVSFASLSVLNGFVGLDTSAPKSALASPLAFTDTLNVFSATTDNSQEEIHEKFAENILSASVNQSPDLIPRTKPKAPSYSRNARTIPQPLLQRHKHRYSVPICLRGEVAFSDHDWEKEWVERENMLKGGFLAKVKHWKGKITFPSGDYMEGEWVDGQPVVPSKLAVKDGTVFEGEYDAGNQRWKGKMLFANGNGQEGEWVKGRPQGQIIATTRTGIVFIGTMTGDHRCAFPLGLIVCFSPSLC